MNPDGSLSPNAWRFNRGGKSKVSGANVRHLACSFFPYVEKRQALTRWYQRLLNSLHCDVMWNSHLCTLQLFIFNPFVTLCISWYLFIFGQNYHESTLPILCPTLNPRTFQGLLQAWNQHKMFWDSVQSEFDLCNSNNTTNSGLLRFCIRSFAVEHAPFSTLMALVKCGWKVALVTPSDVGRAFKVGVDETALEGVMREKKR